MPMMPMPGMAQAQSQPQMPQAPQPSVGPSNMMPNPGMGAQMAQGVPGAMPMTANQSDWNEQAHGAVPPNTETSTKQVLRAMHNAYANKGVNPYDSHPEMKAKLIVKLYKLLVVR